MITYDGGVCDCVPPHCMALVGTVALTDQTWPTVCGDRPVVKWRALLLGMTHRTKPLEKRGFTSSTFAG